MYNLYNVVGSTFLLNVEIRCLMINGSVDTKLCWSIKDYYITGHANPISCAVGLRKIPIYNKGKFLRECLIHDTGTVLKIPLCFR